jgi:hypothetical protein
MGLASHGMFWQWAGLAMCVLAVVCACHVDACPWAGQVMSCAGHGSFHGLS